MLRFATFLAISVFAFQTPASGEGRHVTGERDGVSFDYTVVLRPNEDVLIRGVYLDTSERFKLTVNRRGWVDGTVGGWPVSFAVGQARRNGLVASLKVDAPIAVAQAAADR
jgi:hypothetical protein